VKFSEAEGRVTTDHIYIR